MNTKAKSRRKVQRCKTKGCQREVTKVGVCSSCYSVVYRAVAAGKLSWDEAEERGLVARINQRSPMQAIIREIASNANGN